MRAGALSDKITIQHFTTVRDDWGQEKNEWVDLASVWANVRFMSGKEYISADREATQTQASIRIRSRAIDSTMRVLFDGKVYEITAVLPNKRSAYIDLAAREIA